MLSPQSVRRWCSIHKWTSLICTVFLLMLCVTGLPLVFHDEIDKALSDIAQPAVLPAQTAPADLDRLVAAVHARIPGGGFVHYVLQEPDEPHRLLVTLGEKRDAPPDQDRTVAIDNRTGQILGEITPGGGVMGFILKLHTEMFLGIPGKLFLGGMGILFLLAIVSGVVVYAPFVRERSFGVVRRERGVRLKWLDLHNVLGVVISLWLLVVGATGVLNTGADLLLNLWQVRELSAMTAAYRGLPPAEKLGSFARAVETAEAAEPAKTFSFAAYPGTPFTSANHYAIFMRGHSALTARLVKPVLIDAQTGVLTDKRDLPWYLTSVLVSQPLHFGDYGGLPLKVIWALLDLLAIVVLASGVYLWWKRRRIPVEIDLRSHDPAAAAVLAESEEKVAVS